MPNINIPSINGYGHLIRTSSSSYIAIDNLNNIFVAVKYDSSWVAVYKISSPFNAYTEYFRVNLGLVNELGIAAQDGNVYIISRNSEVLSCHSFVNGTLKSIDVPQSVAPRRVSIAISGGYLYTASQESNANSYRITGSKYKIVDGDVDSTVLSKITYGTSSFNGGSGMLVPYKGGVIIGGSGGSSKATIFSNVVGDMTKKNAFGFVETTINNAFGPVVPSPLKEGNDEKLILLCGTAAGGSSPMTLKKSIDDTLNNIVDIHTSFSTSTTGTTHLDSNPGTFVTTDKIGNIYVASNEYDGALGISAIYIKKITPSGSVQTLFEKTKNDIDNYLDFIYIPNTTDIAMGSFIFNHYYEKTKISSVYGDILIPKILPTPSDIGSSDDRTSLLKYTLSNYPTNTIVVEKINGVVVGTKTIVNDTEYTVSATLAQWNAVKFGKYKDTLGNKNVVTLEVSTGEVYTYPFTKTLPTTAKTNDVLVAVDDMSNTAMASHKKKLVDAIGNKATVGGTGTLEDIAKAIESISVESLGGKRIATGTFKTNSSAEASVRGISFKPKGIIYRSPDSVASGVSFEKDFYEDLLSYRPIEFGENNSGSRGTNIVNFVDGGFDIKTAVTAQNYNYMVFD